MEDYDKIDDKCIELKKYVKRVMDLYIDAKKWHWLSEETHSEEERQKYHSISNTLMDMFNREISTMK